MCVAVLKWLPDSSSDDCVLRGTPYGHAQAVGCTIVCNQAVQQHLAKPAVADVPLQGMGNLVNSCVILICMAIFGLTGKAAAATGAGLHYHSTALQSKHGTSHVQPVQPWVWGHDYLNLHRPEQSLYGCHVEQLTCSSAEPSSPCKGKRLLLA